VERRGIPHLANNERDMGPVDLLHENKKHADLVSTGNPWGTRPAGDFVA
jgi:hypothetical protein